MEMGFPYRCEIQHTSSKVVTLPVETFNPHEHIHKNDDDRCLFY